MIRHTVVFILKHSEGSIEEKNFLKAAAKLKTISTVKNFEILRQISANNKYKFGLSMEFDDDIGYQFYNNHPDHQAFVKDRWISEVNNFQEIDYIPYSIKA